MAQIRSLESGMPDLRLAGRATIAALAIAYLLYAWIIQGGLIVHVDNYFISMVSNGLYGEDAYCLFINPALSLCLKGLSTIAAGIDWFTMLSQVLTFFGLTWIFVCLMLQKRSAADCLVVFLVEAYVVMEAQLFNCNFTISASLFAAVGWFSLSGYARWGSRAEGFRHKFILLIIAGVYYSFAFMYRWECALLSVPFVIIDLFPAKWERGRLRRDKALHLGALCRGMTLLVALGILFMGVSFGLTHHGAYEEASRYNNARSSIVDYPAKSWNEVSEDLPWLSDIDYALLHTWFFADTSFFDTDRLQEIAHFSRTDNQSDNSILSLAKNMESNLAAERGAVLLVCVIGFALFLRGRLMSRVKIATCFALVLCIFGYYTLLGRLPSRVVLSVLLFLLIFMLNSAFCLDDNERPNLQSGCSFWAKGVVCVCVLAIFIGTLPAWNANFESQAIDRSYVVSVDLDGVADDAIFFWDSSAYVNEYRLKGLLPTKEYLSRNIPTGTWLYGQPYFEKFLADQGAANPTTAFLERPQTYFLSRDPSLVLAFMREHYAPNVEVRRVGSIGDSPVWEFFIPQQ